jgi:hypothetical protein
LFSVGRNGNLRAFWSKSVAETNEDMGKWKEYESEDPVMRGQSDPGMRHEEKRKANKSCVKKYLAMLSKMFEPVRREKAYKKE